MYMLHDMHRKRLTGPPACMPQATDICSLHSRARAGKLQQLGESQEGYGQTCNIGIMQRAAAAADASNRSLSQAHGRSERWQPEPAWNQS